MSSSIKIKKSGKKKVDKLSKFLGIDSGPSTQLIADMQTRINNPLFKLSIADYEAMCGNKMMIRMMSKVLGYEVKQLKKFCKHINVFTKNIKLSPKSIKKKIDEAKNITATQKRGSLNKLPDDVYRTIVEQYKTIFKIKYVLKDWIPLEKLNWWFISKNPNYIDLLEENPDYINWTWLSENPSPEAIELLKANPNNINWYFLSKNTNTEAIELLKANPTKIDWDQLSENTNPEAIKLLKANTYKINIQNLSENNNPAGIQFLKENPDYIDWKALSRNTNPAAIELLKEYPEEIDWRA